MKADGKVHWDAAVYGAHYSARERIRNQELATQAQARVRLSALFLSAVQDAARLQHHRPLQAIEELRVAAWCLRLLGYRRPEKRDPVGPL